MTLSRPPSASYAKSRVRPESSVRVSGNRELSSACVFPSNVEPVVAPPGSVVVPGRPYEVRVDVVVLPSGVELTDCDGVVEYVHVRPTAFVIVSIAPLTSYVREVTCPKGSVSLSVRPTASRTYVVVAARARSCTLSTRPASSYSVTVTFPSASVSRRTRPSAS
ncbi:MAG: hypothetical protein U0353_06930 [Sandaracinus sp.]